MSSKPPAWWRAHLASFDGRCSYCGQEHPRLHLDHVIPRANRGATSPKNLVAACPSCNASKWKHSLAEWLELLQAREEEQSAALALTRARIRGCQSALFANAEVVEGRAGGIR